MKPVLSIIIVNYNGENSIVNCIDSIKKYISFSHETILVDNASIDNSLSLIKNKFPLINITENKTNLGFAKGSNIGARNAKGEFLLLLNNDAQLTTPLLPAIELLKSNEEIGVLGGLTKYQNGKIQPSYGYFHTPVRIVFSWLSTRHNKWFPKILKRIETNISKYNEIKEVEWVSGAFFLTRESLWYEINGMDEQYFMYIEDVDFCKRVNDFGSKVIYSNKISVVHHVRAGKPYIDYSSLLNTTKSYLIYTKLFHHNLWVIFVRLSLSIIYILRGSVYTIFYIFQTSDKNKINTGKYYIKIALILITNKLNSTNA